MLYPLLAVSLALPIAVALKVESVPGKPAAAPPLESDSWSQWRGPSRDGKVRGPTWPEHLTAETLRLRWRVDDLAESYSGPILSSDSVFTTETLDGEEVVRAYDRASGDLRWRTAWEGKMSVPFFAARNGSWIRATPALDGDRLYVAGMRDVLVRIDARTGAIEWTVDFVERYETSLPAFGFVSSPLIHGEFIYVQAGAALVKLDKNTGASVWRSLVDPGGMDGSAFSSPILATIAGSTQLLVQTRTQLAGVDPETGKELWTREIPAFRGMNILTPTPFEDSVFTAAYGGTSQRLDVTRSDEGYEVTQRWENRLQGNMTSPVIVDDHAYYVTRSNRFACVDLRTGDIAWRSGPTGDEYWSLVRQGSRVLALTNTGRLLLIEADPTEYKLIDETVVSEDETWAHVAVASNEIVVRDDFGLALYEWR